MREPVVAGHTYLISYATDQYRFPGKSNVSLRLVPVDPHYQVAQAQELPAESPVKVTGSFRSALLDESVSYEESLVGPWFTPPSASLWYSWEAPATSNYQISLTQGKARLVVWQEDGGNFISRVSQVENGKLTFSATAGEAFFISALASNGSTSHFRWQLEAR